MPALGTGLGLAVGPSDMEPASAFWLARSFGLELGGELARALTWLGLELAGLGGGLAMGSWLTSLGIELAGLGGGLAMGSALTSLGIELMGLGSGLATGSVLTSLGIELRGLGCSGPTSLGSPFVDMLQSRLPSPRGSSPCAWPASKTSELRGGAKAGAASRATPGSSLHRLSWGSCQIYITHIAHAHYCTLTLAQDRYLSSNPLTYSGVRLPKE